MQDSVSEFFQKLADAFMAGDHDRLAAIYTHPLVVYIEGEITLERDVEQTLANLFERREAALLAGTRSIRSEVVKVGKAVDGRFPVRVNWYFLSASGREVGRNSLRYFCRRSPDGEMKIEILEFIRRGFENPGPRKGPSIH